MITASAVNGTEIFEIVVTNPDNQKAELIANTIADVLPKKIANIVEGSSVRIVDYAIVPAYPVSPSVTKYTAIGLLFGGMLSVGIIVLMELMNEYIRSEDYLLQTYPAVCSAANEQGVFCTEKTDRQTHLKREGTDHKIPVIIGVVEGDTHDIGKNLVKIMMDTAGFEVYDLGRDVQISDFVQKAKEVKSGIICMSTLMTTTMQNMKCVIDQLVSEGIRDQFKIMVGGGPLSKNFSDKIGADCYTANAAEAAKVAQKLAAELNN